MHRLIALMKGTVAVLAGLFGSAFLLMAGRELAFGDGTAPSPANLSATAQLVVLATWAVAGAVATWLAIRLSRHPMPGLVVSAWLFQMVWLSPGVRPAELWMRAACAIAVALAGFAVAVQQRSHISLTLCENPGVRSR